MANQDLIAYINGEKAKGVSLPDIIAALSKSGWATNDIQDAITATSAPMGTSASFVPQPFRPPVNGQIRTSISQTSPISSSMATTTKSHFWLGFLIGAISSAVIGALLMYATAGWLLPKLTGVNEANDLLNNLQNNSYTPPPQNNTYPVASTSSVPKVISPIIPATVTPTPTTQTTQTQTAPKTTTPTPAPATTPNPTPVAPAYVPTWHRVGEVSGDSATQTDLFAIKGTKWRINWDAVASADTSGGLFTFYPGTSDGSSACTNEMDHKEVGVTKISGIFICDQGNGSYLIDTNSFFVDWHYLIEDYY